ncbi:DUF6056 family protein [Companilactobacillus sp. HBUAS56257]|uniref:DUF6056 family protein n=1 Tax=Companilactobacillus sp. HBUAS56257 TaxID=3109360 RepID=UPI002FEEEED6
MADNSIHKVINKFIFAIIYLYFFIISFLIIPVGDDFFWWGKPGHFLLTHNFFSTNPEFGGSSNGRYLGNFLEISMMHSEILMAIIYASVITLFIWCIWQLAGKHLSLVAALSFFTIIQIGHIQSVFLWLAGFVNYLPPVALMLTYLVWLERYIRHNYHKLRIINFFLALAGGLFIEHMTLYQIFVGLSSIALLFYLKKSVRPALWYLTGAIISAAIMFSNQSYYHTTNEYREVTFNLDKYLSNFIRITHFWIITCNFVIIITICFSIILISWRKFSKITKWSLILPAGGFIIYYLWINIYLQNNYKINYSTYQFKHMDPTLAIIDTWVGIALLIFLFGATFFIFKGINNLKVQFCLFSSIALCVPFFFIGSPVFVREYFSSLVFFFIVGIIYLNKALVYYPGFFRNINRLLWIIVISSYGLVMSMMITNFQVNLKRVDNNEFLRESEVLKQKVPYPNYVALNDMLIMQSPEYWHNRLNYEFNDYFYNKQYK